MRLLLPTLLLLSLALNLAGNGWGLPHEKSWSNDDPTPDVPLEIASIWTDGWHKYPYLLPWIDRALYEPQLAAWRRDGSLSTEPGCRPPTDDDCFTDVYGQLGRLMRISRVARAVMATGTVWAVYVLAATVLSGAGAALAASAATAGLLAAAFVAVSQVLVFYGHVGNVDIPMTFFFAWSIVAWMRALESGRLRDHVAFGLLGGAALACKEAIYGAYVLPGAGLVVQALWRARRFAREEHAGEGARDVGESGAPIARILLAPIAAGAAVLSIYGLANNVLLNPAGFREHISYWTTGTGIAPWNEGFAGHVGLAATFVRRLAEGMSIPLLAVAATGGVLAMRNPRARLLALPALSYYLFTIATVRFAYTRFTLPVVVATAALAGVGWAGAWQRSSRTASPIARTLRPVVATVVLLAIGHGLLYSLHTVRLMHVDARYEAEAWLTEHVPSDTTIAVFGSRTHLPRLHMYGFDTERIDDGDFDESGFAALEDGPPMWLVLSDKTVGDLDGSAGAWRDALLGGDADYDVVLDAHSRSGLERWLVAPWTESRVNPRVWVLRRQ